MTHTYTYTYTELVEIEGRVTSKNETHHEHGSHFSLRVEFPGQDPERLHLHPAIELRNLTLSPSETTYRATEVGDRVRIRVEVLTRE